jgi:hypothetical protein
MKSVARAFGADRLSDAAQQLEAEHPRLRDYVGRLASA